METKIDKVIEKWFEKHGSLTKDNFDLLKEIQGMFQEDKPIEADVPKTHYKLIRDVDEQPMKETKTKGKDVDIQFNRGKRVTRYKGVPIMSKVLDAVKEQMKNPEQLTPRLMGLMKTYYPYLTKLSMDKYVWAYQRYINDNIKGIDTTKTDIPTPTMPSEIVLGKPKGTLLKQYGNNKVYSNIATELLNAVKSGQDTMPIFKAYYPQVRRSTMKTYRSMYKRYFTEIGEINKTDRITVEKSGRQPPTDAYAYNEMYATYVLKREVENVARALQKVRFGYSPTVRNIAEETDMSIGRVRAVLNTLLLEKKISIKTSGIMNTPTYYMM
jgi:hypothetical protein